MRVQVYLFKDGNITIDKYFKLDFKEENQTFAEAVPKNS